MHKVNKVVKQTTTAEWQVLLSCFTFCPLVLFSPVWLVHRTRLVWESPCHHCPNYPDHCWGPLCLLRRPAVRQTGQAGWSPAGCRKGPQGYIHTTTPEVTHDLLFLRDLAVIWFYMYMHVQHRTGRYIRVLLSRYSRGQKSLKYSMVPQHISTTV